MNWYKIAQSYDVFTPDFLIKEVRKLLDISSQINKDNSLSWEEKNKKTELINKKLNKIDEIMDYLNKKEKMTDEELTENIKKEKYNKIPVKEFLRYHRTGYIPSTAYKNTTLEGISWLGNKEQYPLLLKTKKYKDEIIEFRKSSEKNKYVKTDKDRNIMRNGNDVIYLTDDEIKQKGLNLYDTSITAFNEKGQPIGWASDEFGADGVWIAKEYQGIGIGLDLLYEFRKQFKPERRMGQMTPAGENLSKKYYKKLLQDYYKNKRKNK